MLTKPVMRVTRPKKQRALGRTRKRTTWRVLGAFFSAFRNTAYRRFPSFIPNPERHELLEMFRRHDADDNAKSEPPSGEVIDLHCVWAIEFYTPSHISKLLRGFESLGWNRDDTLGFDRNPTRWVQRNRELPHGGAWFNLGRIQRPGGGTNFGLYRQAPLPSGVKYALATMYSLTSSITCIAIGFVLDETQNRRFEQALRRTRRTYMVPLQGAGAPHCTSLCTKANRYQNTPRGNAWACY